MAFLFQCCRTAPSGAPAERESQELSIQACHGLGAAAKGASCAGDADKWATGHQRSIDESTNASSEQSLSELADAWDSEGAPSAGAAPAAAGPTGHDVAPAAEASHGGGEEVTVPPELLTLVRSLCDREAHLRAYAALQAHGEALDRAGSARASAAFQAFCASDEDMRRLSFKRDSLRSALENLQYDEPSDDGAASPTAAEAPPARAWTAQQLAGAGQSSTRIWAQIGEDGKASFRVSSPFAEPVDRILSLFNEIDLYPSWVPFLSEAKTLHVVRGCGNYAQYIVLLRFALPWPLKTREAIVYAFACDRVERGQVLMCARSVPADAASWWGYPIPAAGSAVRVDMTLEVGFIPEGPDYQHTRMDLFLKMDPKVQWLSQSTVNKVGRLFATQLSNNVTSICQSFSKSPYPERLAADPTGAYAVMYECLESLRQGRLPEAGGPQAHHQTLAPE